MNPKLMTITIKNVGTDVRIEENVVHFYYKNVPMILVYDTNADRMRIISPIIEVKNL